MSKKRQTKDKPELETSEEEKVAGEAANETGPAQTFDGYQCTGNVEMDFPQLCALLGRTSIPTVRTIRPVSPPSSSADADEAGPSAEKGEPQRPLWWEQRLQVELEEKDDPLSAKSIRVSGWTVDEEMTAVLQKMLPSLSRLQSAQFWKAGLTDHMITSLLNTVSLCSSLRVVSLEGNPLPEQTFHRLLSADSALTEVSLRNNRIDDGGAASIGSALSTTRTSNKTLVSLSLAFNSITDEGAASIAKGLRFNRALLFLSLANNQIGDAGAAHLAEVLGDFALTHEEVVERRKQLWERKQALSLKSDSEVIPVDRLSVPSSSSLSFSKGEKKGTPRKKGAPKKEEKPAANKEKPKSNKKAAEIKTPPSKGGKPGDKDKVMTGPEVQSTPEITERNRFSVSECQRHVKIQEALSRKLEKEMWKDE